MEVEIYLLNKNKQKFKANKYTYQKEVCSGHPECIYASLNIEAINFSLYFLQDHNQRDLRGVCTAIQSLREICNTPVVSRLSSPESSRTLPSWCYLDKTQHQQWSNIQQYNPLENISLEHINLVFLCQEMTTTGMTNLI